MKSKVEVAKIVKGYDGRLIKGNEFFESKYYEFKALFDDDDGIDEFIEDNEITESGRDFERGRLTFWFNMK